MTMEHYAVPPNKKTSEKCPLLKAGTRHVIAPVGLNRVAEKRIAELALPEFFESAFSLVRASFKARKQPDAEAWKSGRP